MTFTVQIDTSEREREITIWKYILFIKLFSLSFNKSKLIDFLTLTNDLFLYFNMRKLIEFLTSTNDLFLYFNVRKLLEFLTLTNDLFSILIKEN